MKHRLGAGVALLFDLDGTLVRTDALHQTAWAATLAPHGIHLDGRLYREHVRGRANSAIVEHLLPHLDRAGREALINDKEARFLASATKLHALPGLDSLLGRASSVGCATALVTNAPRRNAVHVLKCLRLTDRFRVVLAAEDVRAGKPDPTPYLEALSRLELDASRALAFEDSPSGVRASVAAGVRTVGLLTGHAAHELTEVGASRTACDFEDTALLAEVENLWRAERQ